MVRCAEGEGPSAFTLKPLDSFLGLLLNFITFSRQSVEGLAGPASLTCTNPSGNPVHAKGLASACVRGWPLAPLGAGWGRGGRPLTQPSPPRLGDPSVRYMPGRAQWTLARLGEEETSCVPWARPRVRRLAGSLPRDHGLWVYTELFPSL